jgi:hypothetical protein
MKFRRYGTIRFAWLLYPSLRILVAVLLIVILQLVLQTGGGLNESQAWWTQVLTNALIVMASFLLIFIDAGVAIWSSSAAAAYSFLMMFTDLPSWLIGPLAWCSLWLLGLAGRRRLSSFFADLFGFRPNLFLNLGGYGFGRRKFLQNQTTENWLLKLAINVNRYDGSDQATSILITKYQSYLVMIGIKDLNGTTLDQLLGMDEKIQADKSLKVVSPLIAGLLALFYRARSLAKAFGIEVMHDLNDYVALAKERRLEADFIRKRKARRQT